MSRLAGVSGLYLTRALESSGPALREGPAPSSTKQDVVAMRSISSECHMQALLGAAEQGFQQMHVCRQSLASALVRGIAAPIPEARQQVYRAFQAGSTHHHSCVVHVPMPCAAQEARLKTYKAFKEGSKRILVATDLVGRGIDIERVNIVINYDMPESDEVRAGWGAEATRVS